MITDSDRTAARQNALAAVNDSYAAARVSAYDAVIACYAEAFREIPQQEDAENADNDA